MSETKDEQDPTQEDGETVTTASGFGRPERAVMARYKRFDLDTGAWLDAPVMFDNAATPLVPAKSAGPNLQLAERIATAYRITWLDSSGKTCGFSRSWRIRDEAGGTSNTPRLWPPGAQDGTKPNAPSRFSSSALSPDETVKLMDGLARVATELSRPMVMQVEAFHEGALTREREFHERQRQVDQANHERTVARDREFMQAMHEVHQRPRDERIAKLESELEQLRQEDAEAEAEAEAQEKKQGNAWDFAGKIAENAPDLIRTIGDEIRKGGSKAEADAQTTTED